MLLSPPLSAFLALCVLTVLLGSNVSHLHGAHGAHSAIDADDVFPGDILNADVIGKGIIHEAVVDGIHVVNDTFAIRFHGRLLRGHGHGHRHGYSHGCGTNCQ